MPYPSTRKARWLARREKHLARYQRQGIGRTRTYAFGVITSDATSPRGWESLGRLDPLDLRRATYVAQPGTPPLAPPGHIVRTGGGHGNPPHVKIVAGWYVAAVAAGQHLEFAYAGVHLRRPMRWGQKIGRMSGAARRQWGAKWFAIRNGYFPDWDPLGRSPNAATIAAGGGYLPAETGPRGSFKRPYNAD
jgi:hypothetical protein